MTVAAAHRPCRVPRGHPGEQFIPGTAHVPVFPVPPRIFPNRSCRVPRAARCIEARAHLARPTLTMACRPLDTIGTRSLGETGTGGDQIGRAACWGRVWP